MKTKLPLVVFTIFPFLFGCVSLNEVHDFAGSSVQALNKINDIDYSFTDYCWQDCELQQLRKGEINPAFTCNCTEAAANADDAISKIHYTITAYLVAIEQLSNNKNFSYDVSRLSSALSNSNLLRLSDQQLSAATKAGNFIATAATMYYRQKKMRQYLGAADSIFQDLTETFIYLIDNRLRAQLKIEYDTRLPNIKQMLANTNDAAMKQILVKLYLDETAYYKKHNNLIDKYAALLRSVQKGYHELYIHRNNLKDQSTKEIINRYKDDLQYLLASIK